VAEEQLEHQVQTVLRALHIPSSEDIKRLDAEIDRIAKKLDVQLTERALAALPIENYKGMNVKDVRLSSTRWTRKACWPCRVSRWPTTTARPSCATSSSAWRR
jgi:hypothetical protein